MDFIATKIDASEIEVGLALLLEPVSLDLEGGKLALSDVYAVSQNHYFVCVSVREDDGDWVALYSRPGPGRVEIGRQHKRGHQAWLQHSSHAHPRQLWVAPHRAVVLAAEAAHDLSQPGQRNIVLADGLTELQEAVAWLEYPA